MKLHKDKLVMELLITTISEKNGVRRDVLGKDYYVTLLLKELTTKENQNFSYFKGGTALYKALKSIRRYRLNCICKWFNFTILKTKKTKTSSFRLWIIKI